MRHTGPLHDGDVENETTKPLETTLDRLFLLIAANPLVNGHPALTTPPPTEMRAMALIKYLEQNFQAFNNDKQVNAATTCTTPTPTTRTS